MQDPFLSHYRRSVIQFTIVSFDNSIVVDAHKGYIHPC